MVKIYISWISSGKMTVEDVPPRWRADVEELLKEEGGAE